MHHIRELAYVTYQRNICASTYIYIYIFIYFPFDASVDICDTAQIFVSNRAVDKNIDGTKELTFQADLWQNTEYGYSLKVKNVIENCSVEWMKLGSLCTDARAVVHDC
jgi:hypothetical protein